MGSTLTSDKYFRKISRRTARFHDEEFRSYFVSDAISGPLSRGIIRVLPPSSLTQGKGLNNVARHKGQVSCTARHSWHFREKRTESLSVLPPGSQQPLPASTQSGKTYLGVLISFTRRGERGRQRIGIYDEEGRGEDTEARAEAAVNRLRHVDDATKGKAVNFKLLF